MRCVDASELRSFVSDTRFMVSEDGHFLTNEAVASKQTRLAGGGLRDGRALVSFCRSTIRWLPERSARAILITDARSEIGDARPALDAMRTGLGELRPLEAAPIHLTAPHSWTCNQLEITPEQAHDEGLLVGMLSLIFSCNWNAWLLVDGCSDTIEFWEGDILFD